MAVNGDSRGWRMALVPDALVNPPQGILAGDLDVLATLDASGYGVLQLPPGGGYGLLLAVIADQVAEYSRHGYAVVAVGTDADADATLHWRRLAPLLRSRGIALPPRHLIRPAIDVAVERRRLEEFLTRAIARADAATGCNR